MNSQWRKICDTLQTRLNSGTYKVWVAPLSANLDGETLSLTAPNDFVAGWVRDRLLSDISDAASEVCQQPVSVSIVGAAHSASVPAPTAAPAVGLCTADAVQPLKAPVKTPAKAPLGAVSGLGSAIIQDAAPSRPRPAVAPMPAPETGFSSPVVHRKMEQGYLPISMPLRQDAAFSWRYGFDGFVVGPNNDMAYAAAQNMTRTGSHVDMLFLSSGPGLGKTHLTQAVGHALCEASNRSLPKVEYLTAEEFSSCFVQALRARDMDRFKGRFRDVDVLLLEDVHFLQGKEKMQDEVLSTIKALQGRGSRVVLTSSFAPCELRNVDNSLVSRFCSGFLAGINKPDQATRHQILMEKARQQDFTLADSVAELLASRLSGDIRQLESCISNLILKAKVLGCSISVDMATEILAQYVQDNSLLDVDAIIRKVCEGFGLLPQQLASRSRKQSYVVARNTIFYLARRHTDLSLQDIGDKFSRRHSTVLKGIASVERELKRESSLGRQIASTLAVIERR